MSDDPTIPGLEPPRPGVGALERATRETLQSLREAQLLEPRHAMTCQLMIELARSVEQGRKAGRASAVAMAAAQLREAFLSLPEPAEGGGEDDPFAKLARELHDAAQRDAAVRDAAHAEPTD